MTQNHKEHSYLINVRWTGNLGSGTSGYNTYKRDHEIFTQGKMSILGSSDPAYRGDTSRYNPEELLIASISACHMLWYLHLCADTGIVVNDYQDEAYGIMLETEEGGGHFAQVTLRPVIKVLPRTDIELALKLHERAHHLCFIARSVNFPILCEPSIKVE